MGIFSQCVVNIETNKEAAGATRLSRYHYIAIEGSLAGRLRQPSLRGVKRRSNLGRGGRSAHSAWGASQRVLGPSPRPPSFQEGGIIITLGDSGGHPQTPANGAAPLWTPRLHVLGGSPRASPTGPRAGRHCEPQAKQSGAGRPLCTLRLGGVSKSARTIPPTPFLPGRGHNINSGGHPQTPANGAAPLWTPRLHVLGGSPRASPTGAAGGPIASRSEAIWGGAGRPLCTLRLGGVSKSARTIPPTPFLPGRGHNHYSGGHPQTPGTLGDTPRPLPTGLRPSGLPAYTRWGAPYSYALNCLLSLISWLKYDDPRSGP